LTLPSDFDFVQVHETANWRWWTTQPFWNQYQNQILALANYPESYLSRLRADFGYDIGQKMDLVLDPDSHGGATGTPWNTPGVTIAADSIYNVYNGIPSFWFYILSLHESVNVWTGYITPGWPWADGSSIWHGGSQFPNMADIIITRELGLTDVSTTQASRMNSDPGVQLLLNLQHTFGWNIYQGLLNLIRQHNVILANYAEPAKTAIIILFMSATAGVSLLSPFIQANVGVTANALQSVQQLFPDVIMPFDATPWLVALGGLIALGIALSRRMHHKAK
jgi:hypothetical protein